MSRTFNDSIEEELSAVFFDANEFAETVSIRRASLPVATGVAAMVKTRFYETVNDDGFATSVESIDFDFLESSYLVLGQAADPRSGDRITRSNGDVYEVLPVGSEPCFKKLGTNGQMRVHTKRIT